MSDFISKEILESKIEILQNKVIKKIDQQLAVNGGLPLNEESVIKAINIAINDSYLQGFIDAYRIIGKDNPEIQLLLNRLESQDIL